jgi:DNA modification methylase
MEGMKYQHCMKTTHNIYFENSQDMGAIPSGTAHLVVTSPPYPMIEMWDDMFSNQNTEIAKALNKGDGWNAFELMHRELDPVWKETHRILANGGIACINIGDATRTIGGNFKLYPNHSRILAAMIKAGFSPLPTILWRKATNAPNKFMGSGMLPAGAYVTLEHEYILVLRKGSKREFKTDQQKQLRRQSAFFWEERNAWFSDVWLDIVGTSQNRSADKARLRSAAFPFELSFRLINMFSTKNDIVVDPFLGTGTTMAAAMATGRNCMGFEIDAGLKNQILSIEESIIETANNRINQRIRSHIDFIDRRLNENYKFKHVNNHYDFSVMTRQEVDLFLNPLKSVERINENTLEVIYMVTPDSNFRGDRKELKPLPAKKTGKQRKLF